MYEICDYCKKCQKRHLTRVKKKWEVRCHGIPKKLWEKNYYPLEEVLDKDVYDTLTIEEKIKLQYKFNPLLWAEHKLGWTPVNPKRKQFQEWQKAMILCSSKNIVGRLGRRMGKCTHKETFIQTNLGPIKAKDLNNKIHSIYTFDEKEKKLKLTNDFYTFDNGIKQIYKIKTRLGNEDKVTFNHPYLIFRDNEFKWIEAKDLKLNDKVCITNSYERLLSKIDTNIDYYKEYNKTKNIPIDLYNKASKNDLEIFLNNLLINDFKLIDNDLIIEINNQKELFGLKHLFKKVSISVNIEDNNIIIYNAKNKSVSKLKNKIDKDYIFDEITEITKLKKESSIGITVNETHTFVTNDIWTHNTEVLCIKGLHFIDTTDIKNANLMIVGPYQNLLEEIFDRLKLMLDGDKSVFANKYRSTKKPYTIQIGNNKILGFTTGTKSGSEGASTRGQRCDELYLDEVDYMSQKDIETVMALRMEHPDFRVMATSTPAAIPGLFRKWCKTDSSFKDFHFPSTLLSSYKAQEKEIKSQYNKDGFAREILADFFENSSKVFLTEDIRKSFVNYNYINSIDELENPDDWLTTIGCDWNSFKNGVNCCVLGFNKVTQKLRVLKKEIIKKVSEEDNISDEEQQLKSKHLQTEAIKKIINLFHSFKARAVYVDKGYGGYQCETLEKYFYDIGYGDVFKGIDFGSFIKQKSPFTGESVNKRLKGVMVYSLQQQFEKNRIEISPLEEGTIEDTDASFEECIVYQMQFYSVDHYDGRDNPVFSHKGDHILDAFMLANYAFIDKVEKSIHFEIESGYATSVKNVIKTETSKYDNIKRSNFLEIFNDEDFTPSNNKKQKEEKEEEIFLVNRLKKSKSIFNKKRTIRSSFL